MGRFHAHGGWLFSREVDGAVIVEPGSAAAATFTADTWASIVASVSSKGENTQTWDAARALHTPVADGSPTVGADEPLEHCACGWSGTASGFTSHACRFRSGN